MIKTIKDVFAEFPYSLSEKEIHDAVREAKHASKKELATKENLRMLFSCIDLTSLNATDTKSKIRELVQKVNEMPDHFPGMPHIAAICVYPNLITVVKTTLRNFNIKMVSVAGAFPHSMTLPEVKASEAKLAVQEGADEVDVTLSLSAFLEEDYQFCFDEIYMIKKAIGDARLKVILETGTLEDPEKIWNASVISMAAGADFIKTSTGKTEPSATLEAAYVMVKAIHKFYEVKKRKVGFKPAGGIVDAHDALGYLGIVQGELGEEWLYSDYFRIGASRLANNLLCAVYGEEIKYF